MSPAAEIEDGRFLVTGGAGTVGLAVVDHLVAAGAREVLVLDSFAQGRQSDLASAVRSGRVRVVTGDVRDADAVEQVTRGVDGVFHLASIRTTDCDRHPRLANEVLVDGTFNVIEAAARHGVRKLVLSAPVPPLTAGDTIHAAAQAYVDGLVRTFFAAQNLDYVTLRHVEVYGPRMRATSPTRDLVLKWIDGISRGLGPVVPGDGRRETDLVFTDDLARAHLLAMASPLTNRVYTVGGARHMRLREWAQALLVAMDSELEIAHDPHASDHAVSRRLLGTDVARQELALEPMTDVVQGLRRLVSWWWAERATATELEPEPMPTPKRASTAKPGLPSQRRPADLAVSA